MARYSKQSNGLYRAKISLGGGKYKYLSAHTPKELDIKIRDAKIKLGKGIDIGAEKDTFLSWAERWLSLKKLSVSDGRYKSYTYRVNKMSELHNIPISKITVADIQEIINAAAENGAAEKTIKEYKSVFSQICDYAIVSRVMDFNPAKGIIIPQSEPAEERRALTRTEQSWITAPTEHRAHVGAMIMMLAGLRRGELLALTWNDIDIPNRRITVNKAMVMVDGKPEIKHRTKTKAGMRTVNIPRLLTDFLEAERSKSKSLLVVPGLDGNVMSGDCWQSLWESYLCELNFRFGDFSGIMVTDKDGHRAQYRKPASRFAREKIPMVISKFTAHWLRHTFITNLYMAGVDVVTASKQAGHADIQTTMDIYTHLDDEFKVNQMSKLDDFLSKMG